jgi:hypothetical protein
MGKSPRTAPVVTSQILTISSKEPGKVEAANVPSRETAEGSSLEVVTAYSPDAGEGMNR